METKRTKATDIAEICTLLDGKVDFQTISFNQVLTTDHGKSINDLLFVSKQYGIWFYTSRSAFESDVCGLRKKELPTYVVCEGSKNVYEISNKFRA
jgi:hypothetical protein